MKKTHWLEFCRLELTIFSGIDELIIYSSLIHSFNHPFIHSSMPLMCMTVLDAVDGTRDYVIKALKINGR